MAIKPGDVLHGVEVLPPHAYLINRAYACLMVLALDQIGKLTKTNGVPRKLTRAEWGQLDGKVSAYLDAAQAVEAESSYFTDNTSNMRIDLLARVIEQLKAEGFM